MVTGVLVARTLGPEDRGYLALIFLVPAILQQVGALGLPLATTFFIASDPSQERAVLRAIKTPALSQVVILTVIQGVVLWLLVGDEPRRVQEAGVVSMGILAGSLADIYGKALLQGQRRYGAYNLMWNGIVTFYLLGVVALVTLGRADLVTISVAWVLANLAAGGLSLAVALATRPLAAEEKPAIARGQLFRFGLRGFAGTVSPIATFRLDQAVIGLFLAPRALGLYAAALAFTNLPGFISRGIATIALPQVARARADERDDRAGRFLALSIVLTGLVVVALELTAGRLVPFFFGSDFDEAVPITRILLIGAFFTGARRVLTDAASGRGRPGLGSMAELVSWIALAPALVLLMPIWGVEGVAAAMTISSAISLLALILLLRSAVTASRRSSPRTEPPLITPSD